MTRFPRVEAPRGEAPLRSEPLRRTVVVNLEPGRVPGSNRRMTRFPRVEAPRGEAPLRSEPLRRTVVVNIEPGRVPGSNRLLRSVRARPERPGRLLRPDGAMAQAAAQAPSLTPTRPEVKLG